MKLIKKLQISILLSCLIVASCTHKPDNTIRIGLLHGPSEVSFIHMMANPPEIEGKKIEFIIKDDPQQIQALIIKNELDLAVLPTSMAANLYNKKVNYSMVACPIWGTLYLVSNAPEIKNIKDISNQTVSVFGQGATPDILFRRFIEKHKLKHVKLDYSYSGNSELLVAILSGKTRLGILSEPAVSLSLQKDSNLRILTKIDCEDYIYNTNKDIFTQSAFVVSTKFAKEYPESMHLLCEAYSVSCNKVNEDPQKTSELIHKFMPFDNAEIAINSLNRCNIRYVASFAIEKEINNYLQIFFDFNPETIGGKLPDRNFIYQPQ